MKRYKLEKRKRHGNPHPEEGFSRGKILLAVIRLEKLKGYCEDMAEIESGSESRAWNLYADALDTMIYFIDGRL
jgi:hypothetical protein